jgi:hypothetical protein
VAVLDNRVHPWRRLAIVYAGYLHPMHRMRPGFFCYDPGERQPTQEEKKKNKDLDILLVSIWLIETGLIAILGLDFIYKDLIMGVIALGAGILLLFRR